MEKEKETAVPYTYPDMYKRPGVTIALLDNAGKPLVKAKVALCTEKYFSLSLEYPDSKSEWNKCKPILRRMEDMDGLEKQKYDEFNCNYDHPGWKVYHFCMEHGFDFIGLIDSGHAIDAKTLETNG